MDRRIVALLALALLMLPLLAASIPVVRVEAQSSSVVVSSQYKAATLMVKITDVSSGEIYYLAAKIVGGYVVFEVLRFTGSTYIMIGGASNVAAFDPDTNVYATTFNYNFVEGFVIPGVVPDPSYAINAVFYNYTDTVAMMVISNSANYAVEAAPAVIKDAAVLVTYEIGDTVYGFAASLTPGGFVVFEVYNMSESPYVKLLSVSAVAGFEPGFNAYAASLWYDPEANQFSIYWGVYVYPTGFTAILYNYTTVIVEELYYNGRLVNSSLWSVAAVKTNTVTFTTNVTTTVINLVPVTQTSYVTETVTVPRAIITTETSIMLVLFMLLLLALGIVLYYLMKRG